MSGDCPFHGIHRGVRDPSEAGPLVPKLRPYPGVTQGEVEAFFAPRGTVDRVDTRLQDQLRHEGILDQALEMAMTTPLSLAQAGERIRATKALAERCARMIPEALVVHDPTPYAPAPDLRGFTISAKDMEEAGAEMRDVVERLSAEHAKHCWQVVAVDECQPVHQKARESARQARKRRKRENRAAMSKAREGVYIYDEHLGCHVHRVTDDE